MDAELTFVGLFFVELGTLVALGFRDDLGESEEDMIHGGTEILGTSTVARWYHDSLLPWLGYQFRLRAFQDEAHPAAITARGETSLYRFGWGVVFAGMPLQLFAQGTW